MVQYGDEQDSQCVFGARTGRVICLVISLVVNSQTAAGISQQNSRSSFKTLQLKSLCIALLIDYNEQCSWAASCSVETGIPDLYQFFHCKFHI